VWKLCCKLRVLVDLASVKVSTNVDAAALHALARMTMSPLTVTTMQLQAVRPVHVWGDHTL
jgi:hypothetical protein